MSRFLNYEEVVALLRLPKNSIYSLVHRHQIPHTRLSRRLVRFEQEQIEKWLQERNIQIELPDSTQDSDPENQ